jgi:hypothetical protein
MTQEPIAPGRLIMLLGLLAIVLLWLQHHLGFQLATLGIIAGIGTAWSMVEKAADWLGEKRAATTTEARVRGPLRKALRWASRPGPLVVIYILLVVPMTLVTSITVTAEQAFGDRTTVSVVALDSHGKRAEATITTTRPLVRFFPIITNPFGRLFRVSATGYLTSAVAVYPLVGHNVVLGRDLAPAPSVLFRPLAEGTSALRDNGVFRISRFTSNGPKQLVEDTGFAGSFRLGPSRPIPSSIIDFWRLQLEAFNATSSERAQMLMLWNAPRQLKWNEDLSPGDSLSAEILRRDSVIARVNFSVGSEPLMDVLIMDLPPARALTTSPPRTNH